MVLSCLSQLCTLIPLRSLLNAFSSYLDQDNILQEQDFILYYCFPEMLEVQRVCKANNKTMERAVKTRSKYKKNPTLRQLISELKNQLISIFGKGAQQLQHARCIICLPCQLVVCMSAKEKFSLLDQPAGTGRFLRREISNLCNQASKPNFLTCICG